MNKLKIIFKKIYLSKWFIYLIILLGTVIRVRLYLFNRSLWLDEASLALNIIKFNYLDLLKPLEFNQAAPPFFLLATKLLANIFGYSEQVLRLFPLLAGILSLFLFWKLLEKIFSACYVPLALSLLVFSQYAIYYSNEFKQYSLDLMCSIIVLTLSVDIYKNNYSNKKCLIYGLATSLIIWFSHPSIFIIAGTSVSLVAVLILKKEIKRFYRYRAALFILIFWLISFLISYFLIVKNTEHKMFFDYWKNGFAPFPIKSVNDILWYLNQAKQIIQNPLGLKSPIIIILMIFSGFIILWRIKEKFIFLALLLPIFFLLLASVLRIYLFSERLILFTLPVFFILIFKGIELFHIAIGSKNILILFFILTLIFLQPISYSIKSLRTPIQKEEVKVVINYYEENKKPNDIIYLYYGAKNAFEYYNRNIEVNYVKGVNSRENPENYLIELQKLDKEGRVWFIFSHIYKNEEELFIKKLNEIGTMIDYHKDTGASIYLYDL